MTSEQLAKQLEIAAIQGLQNQKPAPRRFNPRQKITPLQLRCWQAELRRVNMGDKV